MSNEANELTKDAEQISEIENEEETKLEEVKETNVYSSSNITFRDSSLITKQYPTEIITVIGSPKCGKTTLICKFYDLLLRGQLTDISFKESFTIFYLEWKSKSFRLNSNESERTNLIDNYEDNNIIHLKLLKISESTTIETDFLFPDISGEILSRSIKNSAFFDGYKRLFELSKKVIYLLSSETLQYVSTMENEATNFKNFFLRVFENNIPIERIFIVISKLDIATEDYENNKNLFFKKLKTFLKDKTVSSIEYFETSSKSDNPAIPSGKGIDTLIKALF